ncbi:MAG: hypothetical protein AMXMBFR64_44670 [Myxococcales bacterium]
MHYMLPPLDRIPEARGLVERGSYFVVHAPRQTGKTTSLRALARTLTADGRYAALAFSCEAGSIFGDQIGKAEDAVLAEVGFEAVALPAELRPPGVWPAAPEGQRIRGAFGAWANGCPRPLVLLIDEIDALRGAALESVLRQLRAGFASRPSGAPWSVVLCGLRDVRDYRIASGADPDRMGTSSPFNVKTKSVRLGSFDRDEVRALYGQHTADAGQTFTDGAIERAFALSGGQPWLVNALAREVIEELAVPPSEPITAAHFDSAKERLILARQTHLDSLVARLQEPRVRRVIAPLLAGEPGEPGDSYDDDLQFVRDLGLVTQGNPPAVANPIYREVVVRVLAGFAEASIQLPDRTWVRDGRLDLQAMLDAFADFWREQGAALAPKMPYHEVAAQLVLFAWLQRIVNGGGFIDREYGVGMRRIDVLVRWPVPSEKGGWQREALELKVRRDDTADPTPEGLRQIEGYLSSLGLGHGWLVVFDRRTGAPPVATRTRFVEATTPALGLRVTVLHA